MSKASSSKLPRHIAIIMDGNGRWAKIKSLSRIKGHEEGARNIRNIVRECARIGIKRLTLYAFSSENWKRPSYEVAFLMRLLKKYLIGERKELMDNNIKFAAIGNLEKLPGSARKELDKTIEITSKNTGTILCLALNYGGRAEILNAVREIAQSVKEDKLRVKDISEKTIRKYLYDPKMEDPDLLIRTGGEMRISNFLLWQVSYTELLITSVLWPDFRKKHLHDAINDFVKRERRFGGI